VGYGGRVAALVSAELARRADPAKAVAMAAYMKTDMPFYGVQKPGRAQILRRVAAELAPSDAGEYRAGIEALWELAHREEKYLAIAYARRFRPYIDLPQLDLYERMVVEGAWWDLVDDVAANLVGALLLGHRAAMRPVMEAWVDDDDMWRRRTAILSQLRHRDQTDAEMLFDFCRRRAHETEFFIRKAIGWALREYSKTDPGAVAAFLRRHGDELSGLSRREAAKHL
jgi:3-methyladenine DNA glycosylase AlkD